MRRGVAAFLCGLAAVPWFTIAAALATVWWPRLGPTEEAAYPVRYVVRCQPAAWADGGWLCADEDGPVCVWPGVP